MSWLANQLHWPKAASRWRRKSHTRPNRLGFRLGALAGAVAQR
jgi:hypothetical protein